MVHRSFVGMCRDNSNLGPIMLLVCAEKYHCQKKLYKHLPVYMFIRCCLATKLTRSGMHGGDSGLLGTTKSSHSSDGPAVPFRLMLFHLRNVTFILPLSCTLHAVHQSSSLSFSSCQVIKISILADCAHSPFPW